MKRKRQGIVMLILAIALIVSACSGGANNNPPEGNAPPVSPGEGATTPEATGETGADEPADLTVFALYSQEEWETQFGSYLKEKFPHYNITYINQTDELKIENLVTSGTNVDLYLGRANTIFQNYIPLDLAYDISELVDKHDVDLDRFQQGYIDSVTADGKLYALPVDDNTLVLYYNKELFDRFGVEYPRDGMTWSETLALANQITRNEGGTQYVGFWLSPKHYLRMNQLSLGFIDEEDNVTIDNDGWKQVMETIYFNFSRNPGFQQRATEQWFGHNDFNQDFRVAMYLFGSGWMVNSDKNMPMDWDLVSMPTFEDHPGVGTQPYGNYIGMTSTSQEKDAAMQVMKYLTSDEYQMIVSKRGALTPLVSEEVREAIFQEHPQYGEKNFTAVTYNETAPLRYQHPLEEIIVEQALDEHVIREMAMGNMDVNTALRLAQENGERLLREELSRQ